MTHVVIIGGGGMVGQKLAARLMAHGLNGAPVSDLHLFDVAFPPESVGCRQEKGDLTAPGVAQNLAARRPDVVFHLAAIVSGEAELDFDRGWQVNLFALWHLLEALRAEHEASGGSYRPRIVFASSVAAFGPPYPAGPIPDDFHAVPQTSYGAQKVAGELMIADFSRKGFVDGLSLRLPTISVRPGAPNAALSGCFSAIIREPLNGLTANLPLGDDVRHAHASPRSAARFFTHAAEVDTGRLPSNRALNMPSVSVTIGEQIEALRAEAGNNVVALIKRVDDPLVAKVVSGWPQAFEAHLARELGFEAEDSYAQIIRAYIEDDLPHRR